jgi:hypothetical protein
MTFLGKLFVMVNVGLSLLFAGVAFGVYANGIPWAYDVDKPGQPGGILKEKEKQIQELQAGQYSVENSWRTAREALLDAERQRAQARAWYLTQLEFLRTKASGESPGTQVKMANQKPVMVLDKSDTFKPFLRPEMEPTTDRAGQPLLSRSIYVKELERAHTDNTALLESLDKQVKEDTRLTNLFLDGPGRKGLRTQASDERIKYEGILEEQRLTRPLYVNTAVEQDLILKRQESLLERIKELESFIKKRKMDIALGKR